MFLKFLNSLKTPDNQSLIESIQQGYQTIFEAVIKKISKQQALDKNMFGPVYHGTDTHRREKIESEGFKVFIGGEREGDIKHGYEKTNYHDNIPAPIHHLGYGVYLTTNKAIGKEFNNGSLKGLKEYYINAPRLETINFGAPRTMMKWWMENGYDYDKTKDRVKSTKRLTKNLKSNYDAVWFKGKGLNRLLDGDQIVVFNSKNIYEIDKKLSKPWEVGSKVIRKSDGMRGIIKGKRELPNLPIIINNITERLNELPPEDKSELENLLKRYQLALDTKEEFYFEIKWNRGGTDSNNFAFDINPI